MGKGERRDHFGRSRIDGLLQGPGSAASAKEEFTAEDRAFDRQAARAGESEDDADYSGVEDRLRGLGYLE